MAAVFTLALTAACSDGGPSAVETPRPLSTASPLTLTDGDQGGVTIEVTWLTRKLLSSPGLERAADLDLSRYVAFYVHLDASSTDLSKYDLSRICVLRDLAGGEYQPEGWFPWDVAPDHRDGLLLFRRVEIGGEGVELVFRGAGGIAERSYRWLAPPGD